MKFLISLWKFSRPHTIIGTIISITTIYLIFSKTLYSNGYNTGMVNTFELFLADFPTYFLTLIACLSCNLFITGLNQITDIEIDKINKPNLPLVTGALSMQEAKRIVIISALIALSISFDLSYFFGGLITLIMFMGFIYSVPPIRLKRYHLWAASFISIVRGILVNIGIYAHFHILLAGFPIKIPTAIPILTIFITLFSIGIAWFKDLPDTRGDSEHQINSLALKKSPKFALILGSSLVIIGYFITIIYGNYMLFVKADTFHKNNFYYSQLTFILYHVVGLIVFLLMSLKLNTDIETELKKFYRNYWILFFLEYLVFAFLAK